MAATPATPATPAIDLIPILAAPTMLRSFNDEFYVFEYDVFRDIGERIRGQVRFKIGSIHINAMPLDLWWWDSKHMIGALDMYNWGSFVCWRTETSLMASPIRHIGEEEDILDGIGDKAERAIIIRNYYRPSEMLPEHIFKVNLTPEELEQPIHKVAHNLMLRRVGVDDRWIAIANPTAVDAPPPNIIDLHNEVVARAKDLCIQALHWNNTVKRMEDAWRAIARGRVIAGFRWRELYFPRLRTAINHLLGRP